MKKSIIFADLYNDSPYHYRRTEAGITIRKNDQEILLDGDDETQFIVECCFALKYGQSISSIIQGYF